MNKERPENKEEALKKRIKELEEKLAYANQKIYAYDTFIDIAEKVEGIKIRNRYNKKP